MPRATLERTPGWYVVWFWFDANTYGNKKFYDYDDALAFMEKLNAAEHQP